MVNHGYLVSPKMNLSPNPAPWISNCDQQDGGNPLLHDSITNKT